MNQRRSISILGSTGSIGTQALQVVDAHPGRFRVAALTAHENHKLLFEQVRRYRPAVAGLTSGEIQVPADLRFCEWFFGEDALRRAADAPCDDVLVSVVGMVGLQAVLLALKAGKRVLLANKEALVAGGQAVMSLCADNLASPALLPIDSEHSAIFQCLRAADGNPFERIILTASGGPFRNWSAERIAGATLKDALKHPTWRMGRKITVDSATMFNKALEMMEARWLFNATPAQIEVVVHPESIVHSLVGFRDGAVLAQMGMPDMRAPISYALSFPERIPFGGNALRLHELGTLHFEPPDTTRFPALRLAREAMEAGGTAGCALNAANECAVDAFLRGRIAFRNITPVVEETLQTVGSGPAGSLEQVMRADSDARRVSQQLISKVYSEEP